MPLLESACPPKSASPPAELPSAVSAAGPSFLSQTSPIPPIKRRRGRPSRSTNRQAIEASPSNEVSTAPQTQAEDAVPPSAAETALEPTTTSFEAAQTAKALESTRLRFAGASSKQQIPPLKSASTPKSASPPAELPSAVSTAGPSFLSQTSPIPSVKRKRGRPSRSTNKRQAMEAPPSNEAPTALQTRAEDAVPPSAAEAALEPTTTSFEAVQTAKAPESIRSRATGTSSKEQIPPPKSAPAPKLASPPAKLPSDVSAAGPSSLSRTSPIPPVKRKRGRPPRSATQKHGRNGANKVSSPSEMSRPEKAPTAVQTTQAMAAETAEVNQTQITPRNPKISQPGEKRKRPSAAPPSTTGTVLASAIDRPEAVMNLNAPRSPQPRVKRNYRRRQKIDPSQKTLSALAPDATMTPKSFANTQGMDKRAYRPKEMTAASAPAPPPPELPASRSAQTATAPKKTKHAYCCRPKPPSLPASGENTAMASTSNSGVSAFPDAKAVGAGDTPVSSSEGIAEVTVDNVSELAELATASCDDPPPPTKRLHVEAPSSPEPTAQPTPSDTNSESSIHRFRSRHGEQPWCKSATPTPTPTTVQPEADEPFVAPDWMLVPGVNTVMLRLLGEAKGYYDCIRNPWTNPMSGFLDDNPKAWQTYTATLDFADRLQEIERALTSEQKVGVDVVPATREVVRRLWGNVVYANGRFEVDTFWKTIKGEPVEMEFKDGMITRYGISPYIMYEVGGSKPIGRTTTSSDRERRQPKGGDDESDGGDAETEDEGYEAEREGVESEEEVSEPESEQPARRTVRPGQLWQRDWFQEFDE